MLLFYAIVRLSVGLLPDCLLHCFSYDCFFIIIIADSFQVHFVTLYKGMRSKKGKMKRSTKIICIISAFLFELAVLYLIGVAILPGMELEYRYWVSCIGKTLLIILIPLWLIGLVFWKLFQIYKVNTKGGGLVRLLSGIATVLYLFWCWLACILIVLSTREDIDLGGGMLSVVTVGFPNSTSYDIYESVGLFFRRDSSLTHETAIRFLEDKYKRDFYPVEGDGTILCADAERPDVTMEVRFINGRIQDDYPQALADYYLQEGWNALELNWEYRIAKTQQDTDRERFCLILTAEKDCAAFAEDAYRLMQYASKQDSLLENYDVCLFYSSAEYEDEYSSLRFGRYKTWESLSYQFDGTDVAKITQYLILEYSTMRIRAAERAKQEAQGSNQNSSASQEITSSKPNSTPQPTPQKTDREIAEETYPEQCEAAEAIWNAELRELGYDYEPDLNNKGNLMIWLGKKPSDNLQNAETESDYYLTYDRESKNGNCYLFVLSEVPEGNGSNAAYLREFYACEKVTLNVVAGNKTSWSQTGCAEYREITGE